MLYYIFLEHDTHTSFSLLYKVDPWFNFRATKYLVDNGFYSFWDWFDDRELTSSINPCNALSLQKTLLNSDHRV